MLGNAAPLVFVNKVSTQAVKNVMQCDLMLTKPNGCIGEAQLAKLLNCFVISRWSVRVGQGAPHSFRHLKFSRCHIKKSDLTRA